MFNRKEDSEESSQEESDDDNLKCEYQAASPGAALRTRPK